MVGAGQRSEYITIEYFTIITVNKIIYILLEEEGSLLFQRGTTVFQVP